MSITEKENTDIYSDLSEYYPTEVYPSLDEVMKLADGGDFRRIPVCMEILADGFTPVKVLKTVRSSGKQAFLLESASDNHRWGRYSFIGYEPDMEIICTDGELTISEVKEGHRSESTKKKVKHPAHVIREVLKKYKSPYIKGMPSFTGGLVGYFSYDYIKYSEPELKLTTDARDVGDDFRDVDLMLFDSLIVFDSDRQKIVLITGVKIPEDDISEFTLRPAFERACAKLHSMHKLIVQGNEAIFPPLKLKSEPTPVFSKAEYCLMVEKAKEYIREGDIFQVVLSNPLTTEAEGSLLDTYRLLRTQNPSPYMFYFSSDDVEIAGASPETLVKLEDGVLHTFPLAGTRPRGRTDEEDAQLESELLADEKELAEHNMLVDLGRNDIGRVSRVGSVRVEKYMSIERFSRVMHIGSTVAGDISEDKDALDVVDAILPAGTLSGAPKIRACEIINELEGRKRGIYGGAIGYIDFSGNLDTCIGIRLVYKKNGRVCVRSGAGVVADSVPENEYTESVNKAKAVIEAMLLSAK